MEDPAPKKQPKDLKTETPVYENVVFEGCLAKVTAYAGVIKLLENKKILSSITRVAAASTGAIVALFLGLGFDAKKIESELLAFDFKSIQDGAFSIKGTYGHYSGSCLENWIKDKIEDALGNPNLTFSDLHRLICASKSDNPVKLRDIYLVGTKLSTRSYKIFSNDHSPDMKLFDAVRISMSIPFFFDAKLLKEYGTNEQDVYVDGGLVWNYPVNIFDTGLNRSNRKTLGVRVRGKNEVASLRSNNQLDGKTKITNMASFAIALYEVAMKNTLSDPEDQNRTIFVDTSMVPNILEVTTEQKKTLIKCGEDAAQIFINDNVRVRCKTKKDRLDKFDRKKMFDIALEIYVIPLKDKVRVQYVLEDGKSTKETKPKRKVTKYLDRLKYHGLFDRIIEFFDSREYNIKILEVSGDSLIWEEIQKWSTKANKKIHLQEEYPDNKVKDVSWQLESYGVVTNPQQLKILTDLQEAASFGNLEKTKLLISEKDVNLNYKDDKNSGRTVLHCAADNGSAEIVKLLLNAPNPADIDVTDNLGETALHLAAYQGHLEVMRVLTSRSANLNIKSIFGSTPLHRAARYGQITTVTFLLKQKAIADIKDNENKTPLDYVIELQDKDKKAALIDLFKQYSPKKQDS